MAAYPSLPGAVRECLLFLVLCCVGGCIALDDGDFPLLGLEQWRVVTNAKAEKKPTTATVVVSILILIPF